MRPTLPVSPQCVPGVPRDHITRAFGNSGGVRVRRCPCESHGIRCGVCKRFARDAHRDSRKKFMQRILMVDSEQSAAPNRQVGKGNTWHRLAYLSGFHFLGGSSLNSEILVCRSRLSFSGGS